MTIETCISNLRKSSEIWRERIGLSFIPFDVVEEAILALRPEMPVDLIEKIRHLPKAGRRAYWDEDDDGNEVEVISADDGTFCVDRDEVIILIKAFFSK